MVIYLSVRNEILKIKERNLRVENDKAWETSKTRKVLIAILTYFVVLVFFLSAGVTNAYFNAIIPTIGFLLSTLSLGFFKKLWVKQFKTNKKY
jgi:preprotein translocase subunit SecF